MEESPIKIAVNNILEEATRRDPRDTVRQVCTRLRKVDISILEVACEVSFFLRYAPDIIVSEKKRKGYKVEYSLAVCLAVEKILEYKVYDDFILHHFPFLIKSIICGRLPIEIREIIIGLAGSPLLLPEERVLFQGKGETESEYLYKENFRIALYRAFVDLLYCLPEELWISLKKPPYFRFRRRKKSLRCYTRSSFGEDIVMMSRQRFI